MSEYVDCRTCKTDCVRADGNYGYTFCDKYTHPPMTNADRIRSMTDDELNNFLRKVAYCMDKCPYEYWGKKSLGWLQQPAGEEDKHEAD